MTRIQDRYASAVHSSNLGVDEKTVMSDTDVLGAMSLADKALTTGKRVTGPETYENVRPAPLAVSLERFLSGDSKSINAMVSILTVMALDYSRHTRIKLSRAVASDIARCSLAWFRSGRCKSCGGHGYQLIPGTPTHSNRGCEPCKGTGKIVLEDAIDPDKKNPNYREIARWMVSQIERDLGRAGAAAMDKLAPRLEL